MVQRIQLSQLLDRIHKNNISSELHLKWKKVSALAKRIKRIIGELRK